MNLIMLSTLRRQGRQVAAVAIEMAALVEMMVAEVYQLGLEECAFIGQPVNLRFVL
jgi:hypothetical protein